MGADSGHYYYTRAEQGGAPQPDDLGLKISRPANAGRPQIELENTAIATTLGRRILSIFGHFRLTHTSFLPFLDPLNSFPWSFSLDSSQFERYNKNKFSRLLDRVFLPSQKPLDQGEGTDVFLVSWAFH